jgi:hypothetical protein
MGSRLASLNNTARVRHRIPKTIALRRASFNSSPSVAEESRPMTTPQAKIRQYFTTAPPVVHGENRRPRLAASATTTIY